ncbi:MULTISPECIES: hypothetical protein [Micromonospora]|uniref:hypothetical protein n=1 Tax=unclassified Micromonospora TaxID=2617518 RepID=UPI002FEE70CA
MRPKVDVLLDGKTAGTLTPPGASIIDGSAAASVVRTRCLGRFGLSAVEVAIPVDTVTAERIALTCRMEKVWIRRVYPAIVVLASLLVVAHVIDSMRNDAQYLGWTLLIALVLAFASLAARLALKMLASQHHPKEVKGDVYIRGVDRETAEVWISLNPVGAVRIIGAR